MCRPVDCKVCGKTTWAGCGEHVDSVKAQVPADQWCNGHDNDFAAKDCGCGHEHGIDKQQGVFNRLFKR